MSDCCAIRTPVPETTVIDCPACGVRGTSVELRAVKALLIELALARLQCVRHRFCRTSECAVVYYDETGGTYGRNELRVRVWQKEPYGDRPICYCFAESEATIRDEIRQVGVSGAVQRVRAHIEAARCACDVRNPRGVRCLGDLALAVERIGTEMLATPRQAP